MFLKFDLCVLHINVPFRTRIFLSDFFSSLHDLDVLSTLGSLVLEPDTRHGP
jgi:hypothetical protein